MIENQITYIKILKKVLYIALFFDKKLRKRQRYKLDCKIVKLLQEKYVKQYPDDYIIFSRNGAGDIFFTASLLREFKKTHSGRIIYLTDKPKLKSFIEAFSSVDEVISDKDTKLFQETAPIQKTIVKGQINFLFFPYRGTKKNYVFADSYANLLGVSTSTPKDLPKISDENRQNAENEFKKLHITPEKTIILIPESVMFDYKILPAKFWKTLANKLIKQGYDVVFNSSNRAYKRYKTSFLPICDFIEFSKNAKYIISFRSGICDVLVGCGINSLTALYPPNLEVIWADKFIFDNSLNKYHQRLFETEFENIFHIYSLNSNFKTDKIEEIIYNYNEKQIMERILNKLTQSQIETKIKEWI